MPAGIFYKTDGITNYKNRILQNPPDHDERKLFLQNSGIFCLLKRIAIMKYLIASAAFFLYEYT